MRQLLVGNSITLGIRGPLVAVAAGGSGVGGGEPVLDGVGGVQGAEAEHAAVTTKVTAASRHPNPRRKLTPAILSCARRKLILRTPLHRARQAPSGLEAGG